MDIEIRYSQRHRMWRVRECVCSRIDDAIDAAMWAVKKSKGTVFVFDKHAEATSKVSNGIEVIEIRPPDIGHTEITWGERQAGSGE